MTLLLAFVTTTTTWGGYKLSQPPMGSLEGCEGGPLAIHLWGWTCDPYYETKDLSFEKDCAASEWSKVNKGKNWYLYKWTDTEVHVWKDGREVKAKRVYPNVKRNDVLDHYNFYTEVRYYKVLDIPTDPLTLFAYCIFPSSFVAAEWDGYLDRKIGFDTWIEVDEPGTYQVVVYGSNRQGSESWDQKTQLGSTMTVTVSSGHVLTFEANTTDNVSNMPETQPITFKKLPAWNVTRSGYTFVGWNTEPDGDGTSYRSGDEFPTNADITLYAQWVRDSFLSYNWDGTLANSQTTISSVDDWNDLATAVNNGYLHGKTITLVNDIGDENNPIRRCIGTRQYPFDNHFNGNGHTIYVNINDTIHEGTAPFRCVSKCLMWHDDSFRNSDKWVTWGGDWAWNIYRLKVKGTVRGGKYCSGLVGISRRVELFLCAVQTDVITTSTHCAGVIGYIDTGFSWFYIYSGRPVLFENDKTSILSTVFSGSISGATQSTGIFIGDRRSDGESSCDYCLSTGTVSGANIDFAPPSEVTHSFKTTNHGNQGSYVPYDPAAIVRKMPVLNIIGDRRYHWCVDDDGSILPFHQVYIDTAADWDKIATRIAGGASFKDRELVLNSDITVGTMLGTEEHPFDGTFDGQNHTLTFNLTTDESGCAPFRYIKDASIHDLKIDGTLEHSAGAKTRLAGVAAYTSGNNNRMENITVSSTIRSQASSFHHAGLVAQINDGGVTFHNCAFTGRLLCDANSSGCGGLVAVNMGSGTSFYNCLFAPTECTVGTEQSCTISRDIKQPSIIAGTYYSQELGEVQGSLVYTADNVPDNVFCSLWTGPDSVDYYQPVPTYIGGLQHTYNYNDGKPIDIDYTFYCYQYQQDAEKYTATIRKTTDGTEVTDVTDIGSYTLSITANDSTGYYGTVEQPFYVTASSLPMNDKGHFLINSADDWNTLCELTSYDHPAEYQFFERRIVELTADITVTQQLGFFCGTLAGNGHTVTLNLGTAQSPFTRDGAALIYNLRGNAIVENLHVAGTIVTSTGRFTAGLVGLVGSEDSDQHNVRINNCHSSIRIKTTYEGMCHNGGFVGHAYNGKLALNNCLFDGCFTSEDDNHVKATHWAGFVGYKYNAAVSINSCLFFANHYEMHVPSTNNATFYLPSDASSVSLQNCCHTVQNWGETPQGKYVADYFEAGPLIDSLGYEGWYIKFDYPQWQAYYPEGETRPLVLPRYDYHTAMAGHINGLQGNGIDGDPYLIGSTQDWNLFATSINNNVGAEAYYQLTDDITIDQGHLVGTSVTYPLVNGAYGERRTFRGTFDGNGHTLTLNMATNGDCAPFIYAQDCTIKNLTIAGSITTNHEHAAGLIVNAAGTVNITGCRGSHTINSSLTGAGNHGAFVAQSSGTTNIEGCVFDGSIIGATTYSCGGFVGERSSGTVSVTGSFFTPAAITLDTENAEDNSSTFCVGGATITNSFYTQPVHTGQGTALHSVTAAEGIDLSIGGDDVLKEYASGIAMKGDGLLLDGVFYAPEGVEVPIEKLELITGYSPQDATIAPNAGTYAEGTLTMPAQNVVFTTSTPIALSTYTIQFNANGGTGEAMADMNLTYGDEPVALTANAYTRTAHDFKGWNTEADGSGTAYTDGKTVENLTTASGSTITLYAQWEPWIAEGFGKTDSYTPDGTADNPYVISTAEEWNLLCDYISSGKGNLVSSHYRLDNNLTVSRMMGTEANPFRGTFEGASYTLTLDLTGLDPVELASIVPTESENTGNQEEPDSMEYSENQQPPLSIEIPDAPNNQAEAPEDNGLQALAPFAYVNGATIKNLRTTGTIYGETSYYAAGIVGKAEGNTTLQSCYSNVAITSTAIVAEGDEESPMLGGIVAQSTGTLRFTDCLFDGTINAENTSYCGGFLGQRVSGAATFTNCLMDGELNCDTDGCGTYYQPDENTSDYTFTNSYYHTAYGADQGTQTNDTGENLKERLGENWTVKDGEKVVPVVNTYDLANCKLILSPVVYHYTGSPVNVSYTVRNFYNDLLSENTHYTVTIKNAEGTELTEVTAIGEYTVTIDGTGNYMGTKTVHFYVYEFDGDFPLQIDNDFQYDSDNEGYFYARMPRPEDYWPIDEDPAHDWHDAEDNPRIVNIPAGFTRRFKVYDNGGRQRVGVNEDGMECVFGEYYFGDETQTLTLICPEGYCFRVQGSMKTPNCHPFTIYDGSSVGEGSMILDHVTGQRIISPFVTSGNSITFYLDSREWWGNDIDGFDLTAQVIPQVPPTTLANDDSELEESEKNTSVIAANNGEQINVTLNGRTLYKDGTWNTLCLPFDIADIGSTPLRGANVKALKSTNYSDGALTLNFSHNLTSLEAGKPYIAKWDASATQIHYTATDGTRDVNSSGNDYPSLFHNEDWNSWSIGYSYSEEYPELSYPYHTAYCEFFTSEKMFITGYTMVSYEGRDHNPETSPTKWTLCGKQNLDDSDWTVLDSRDVTETGNPEDAVPTSYDEPKTYNIAADKQGIYKYFRLDVEFNSCFSLSDFQLIGTPVFEDIEDPTFHGVTIKNELHPVTSGGVIFEGNYSSLDGTNGLLLDAHNEDGNAFHATLCLPDVTLYADAEHTTPATGTAIPFADNGNLTFYYSQSDYALTLHDDDSQAADGEKNADLIAAKDGEFAIVTLDGRTLYKDGTWNTICLPFDLSELKDTPLEGAYVKAFALERAENNDGVLTLNFNDVTPSGEQGKGDDYSPLLGADREGLQAGKPYIVKWEHVDFPAFAPSEHLLNSLGFIDEIPTVDDDSYNHEGGFLVDGNTSSSWEANAGNYPSVSFHYATPIIPTGYALWTAEEGDGESNPESWTISAKNEGDEDWTPLVTVNNSADDKLPMTNNTCTLFELNNNTAYQYFLIEPTKSYSSNYGYFRIAELKFFTGHPNTDIVNPVFAGVTIKNQATATDNYFFEGSYSKLASTDGQMLDAHNEGGKAFHATLSLSSLNAGSYDFNCYTDAEHTTPVGGTIPFNASDGSVTLYPKWALTLNNNDAQAEEGEKNTDIISDAADTPTLCDVTLAGRTLYKDGEWNTLCLPFNLGDPQAGEGHYFDGTLLEGATVMSLESTEFAGGTLTMNFRNMPMVIAGVPYIVKWEGDGSSNFVAPVFEDVTISNSAINLETDYVDFIGNYSSVMLTGGDKSVLYLGTGNQLYYPTANRTMNACRAYFQLKGLTVGDIQIGVKMYFGDEEDDADGISLTPDSSPGRGEELYDLNGRKLYGKPLQKGIYINNGRKVVIK